jgi:hypothetical protein
MIPCEADLIYWDNSPLKDIWKELLKANVELDRFEKHALGREYTWEKAPVDDEEKKDEKPTTR